MLDASHSQGFKVNVTQPNVRQFLPAKYELKVILSGTSFTLQTIQHDVFSFFTSLSYQQFYNFRWYPLFFLELVYKLAHLFAKSLSYLQHNKLSQPFHSHSSSEHATNCGKSWIFPENVMKSETNFKLHNLRPFEEEIPSCKKEVKSEKKEEGKTNPNK